MSAIWNVPRIGTRGERLNGAGPVDVHKILQLYLADPDQCDLYGGRCDAPIRAIVDSIDSAIDRDIHVVRLGASDILRSNVAAQPRPSLSLNECGSAECPTPHAHTHTHTHTRARARAYTHTHTRARAQRNMLRVLATRYYLLLGNKLSPVCTCTW
jgi:hypothetical protein